MDFRRDDTFVGHQCTVDVRDNYAYGSHGARLFLKHDFYDNRQQSSDKATDDGHQAIFSLAPADKAFESTICKDDISLHGKSNIIIPNEELFITFSVCVVHRL